MKYETWKEPTGKAYYVFYGLKNTTQLAEAVRTVAKERKIALNSLNIHQACIVGGKELWIDGYKNGAKIAIAIARKGKK